MQSADSLETDAQPKNYAYLKSSLIFVVLSLLSALFNYAYYPVIAHFLTLGAFGATQSLIAILLQVGAIFSGLNLVTIYLVHRLGPTEARHGIETLQKLTTWLFIAVTLIVTLGQSFVLHFLHIDRIAYLLIVSLDLLTSIPFIIAFGYLQAQRRFVAAGFLQINVVLVKLFAGAIAAKWFGAVGALLGISIGQIVGMVLFWLICLVSGQSAWNHRVLHSIHPPTRLQLSRLKPFAPSITAIFLVNVVLAIFISFDIIAARHYFVPSLSGLYSGASTLSNAIVFACLPLIGVLLPHLDTRALSRSRSALFRTSLMVLLAAVIAVTCFKLFPNPLLSLFGHQYIVMNYLLWRLGVLMALVAGLSLSLQVSAFYAPLKTAIACIIGVIALIISVMHYHLSPSILVSQIMLIYALLLVVGVISLIWIYNHGPANKSQ